MTSWHPGRATTRHPWTHLVTPHTPQAHTQATRFHAATVSPYKAFWLIRKRYPFFNLAPGFQLSPHLLTPQSGVPRRRAVAACKRTHWPAGSLCPCCVRTAQPHTRGTELTRLAAELPGVHLPRDLKGGTGAAREPPFGACGAHRCAPRRAVSASVHSVSTWVTRLLCGL